MLPAYDGPSNRTTRINRRFFHPTTALPALLRKWLADYAATGLPPAYLPKEEISP